MKLLLALVLSSLVGNAAFFNNYDTEAFLWRQRVVQHSSTVSANGYVTATRCMLLLKQGGIRRYIQRAGIYLGNDTNALFAPFIRDFGGLTDQLQGFDSAN